MPSVEVDLFKFLFFSFSPALEEAFPLSISTSLSRVQHRESRVPQRFARGSWLECHYVPSTPPPACMKSRVGSSSYIPFQGHCTSALSTAALPFEDLSFSPSYPRAMHRGRTRRAISVLWAHFEITLLWNSDSASMLFKISYDHCTPAPTNFPLSSP